VSGNDLTLGGGAQAPAWVADPTRALGPFGAIGGFLNRAALNATLPWNVPGGNNLRAFSMFWYFKLLSPISAGQNYWLIHFTTPTGDANASVFLRDNVLRVQRSWNSGNTDILDSDTPIAVGQECTFGFTAAASAAGSLTAYLNGVPDGSTPVTGTVVAPLGQPTLLLGDDYGGVTLTPGVPALIGRTLAYDGLLTAAQMQAIYLDYRTIYPGLPPF
jgi:hypothetical protein